MTEWSEDYKSHFQNLRSNLADDCRRHDCEAKKWHNRNFIFMIVFAMLSVVMTLNIPVFNNIMPWVVSLAGALNGGLLYTYGKLDPMSAKAAHIKAASAKSSIADRIQQELLQPTNNRENADEFLSWIYKDIGVVGDASPYLWASGSKPVLKHNDQITRPLLEESSEEYEHCDCVNGCDEHCDCSNDCCDAPDDCCKNKQKTA